MKLFKLCRQGCRFYRQGWLSFPCYLCALSGGQFFEKGDFLGKFDWLQFMVRCEFRENWFVLGSVYHYCVKREGFCLFSFCPIVEQNLYLFYVE